MDKTASVLMHQKGHISYQAAAFLRLVEPSNSSWLLERTPRKKWDLGPGMKLLENRESGAYLWTRGDPEEEDEVHLEFRLPGWRFKIEYAGNLVARGARERLREHIEARAGLAWWIDGNNPSSEPRILLAQVIQFELPTAHTRNGQLFGIVCWAPASLYSAYEAVFENVLSGLRIYP